MTPTRKRRAWSVALLILGLAAAAALMFTAFRENIMYFYTPTDLVGGKVSAGAPVRLGGLVKAGSVDHLDREDHIAEVRFVLADCDHELAVRYEGILPDLFREGQGIVTTGRLSEEGHFVADEVLAKHDENYMPPDLAEKLGAGTQHSCEPFKPVGGRT